MLRPWDRFAEGRSCPKPETPLPGPAASPEHSVPVVGHRTGGVLPNTPVPEEVAEPCPTITSSNGVANDAALLGVTADVARAADSAAVVNPDTNRGRRVLG